MKLLTALLATVALGQTATPSETKLTVTSEYLKGEATLTNLIDREGQKVVRLGMKLSDFNGSTVSILQESVYAPTGTPVRMLQTVNVGASETRTVVTATFTSTGVETVSEAGGKTTKKAIALPEGKATVGSEFWFCRDKPLAGDKSSYWRFDLGKLEWVQSVVQYHGPRQITVNGKSITAHCITTDGTKSYVDDKGDPYLIESPGLTMTRKAVTK